MLKSINTLQIERTMIRMEMKTEILPASDEKSIEKAAALLQNGELVALPTETVYGIAADARNGEAVKKIFVAKGRPQDNPLIVHVTGPEMLPGLVSEVPERAQLLMAAFCPGPLTIIMPRGPEVAAECCAGLDTVGIRMPSHPVARAVIEASGCAFAAPSANLSGKPSPTNAQDVFTDMDGRLPLILDGGECDVGVESTVVSVVGEKPTLFRPGHITLEDLERALGEEVEVSKAILEKLPEGAVVRSPGMKYKHYAPKADVTLLDGTFEQFKAYVDAHAAENPSCLCFTGEAEKLGVPCVEYGREGDGADAVYFGVGQLNMRSKSAANFTPDDLERIVGVARAAGVKSYLTVNTVIYEDELRQMHALVDRARAAGVDAVIASDLSAILYARRIGMEVHISTQCNLTNSEAVKFFSQWADVVVLARELSLDQIGRIARAIDEQQICGPSGDPVRIEMFAHGALCMAVSGITVGTIGTPNSSLSLW